MNNYSVKDIDIRKASEMQNKMKENMEQVKEALQKPISPNAEKTSSPESKLKEAISKVTSYKNIWELRKKSKLTDEERNDDLVKLHQSEVDAAERCGRPYRPILSYNITPAFAKYVLLERYSNNREIRPANLKNITKDISNGEYAETHESIAFNTEGNLIDGQHRLLACVNANKSFPCFITYNLKPESYTHIDRGASRSLHDDADVELSITNELDLVGEKSSQSRSKKATSWCRGIMACSDRSLNKNSLGSGMTNFASNKEQLDFLRDHIMSNDTFFDAIKWFEKTTYALVGKNSLGITLSNFARMTGAAIPLIYYRYIQPESALDFVSKLYKGSEAYIDENGDPTVKDLDNKDPIQRLRSRLLKGSNGDGKWVGSTSQDEVYGLTKKAIHLHFSGKKVAYLYPCEKGLFFDSWEVPSIEDSIMVGSEEENSKPEEE